MTHDDVTVWDAAAATFDDEPDHGLLDPDVRNAWRDLLRPHFGQLSKVLDLGCGTGSLAVLLAEDGHLLTGVDLSVKMLQQAGAKAARHRVDCRFLVGDASAPPVEPEFDVVLARHVVWALPDPAAAFDRWLALLSEYGTLVLVEDLWSTGAGLTADAVADLLRPKVAQLSVRHLPDPALWGGAISDERFLVTASR